MVDRHRPDNRPDSVRLHDMHTEIEHRRGVERRATFLRRCIRYALDHMPSQAPKGKGKK